MRWLRKSKYHKESDPPRFYLSVARSMGEWKFCLVDGNERIGWFDSADEAKAEAERMNEQEG